MMQRLLSWAKRMGKKTKVSATRSWTWFRARKLWQQALIVLVLLGLIIGGFALARGGAAPEADTSLRTVTLQSVGSLSGNGDSVSVIGNVRSVAEAQILAQAGGTVRAVHTRIGAVVPAGYVIAELENATERAQVLQAQGAYDAAIASRNAVSPTDATANVRNTYRSVFSTLDTVLHADVDLFYSGQTALGPGFLLNEGRVPIEQMQRRRGDIEQTIIARRASLSSVDSRDPESLLTESQSDLTTVNTLLEDIAEAANQRDSRATPAQLAGLAEARAAISAQITAINAAREAYRAKSTTSTASVDAGVKSALGSLRLAQASLEKSIIRAPIGGTVNFLPIRVGDYVTAFTHVATVANNGSLEIVTYISESDRENISAGMKVRIDDKYDGIITTISPALDPNTKQIEVHVAVSGTTDLVNGQSVRIAFADALASKPATPVVAGPMLLPLAAVKLSADQRVVFSVEDGRLVAHQVQIGDVRGDRIEIVSGVTSDLLIVTDARGLAEGEKVQVSTSTQPTL